MAGLILDVRNQRCCRFSQVSKVSWNRRNSRAHTEM
jgi:hypothetical protein